MKSSLTFFQEQRTRLCTYLPAAHTHMPTRTHLSSFPVPRHVFWQGSLDHAVSGLAVVRLDPQPKDLQFPCRPVCLIDLVRNSLIFTAVIV